MQNHLKNHYCQFCLWAIMTHHGHDSMFSRMVLVDENSFSSTNVHKNVKKNKQGGGRCCLKSEYNSANDNELILCIFAFDLQK